MPLFDFQCPDCGDVSEQFAKADETTRKCGECGGGTDRLITSRYYLNNAMDITTDAITGEPVNITSKRQMDGLCRDNDCAPSYGKNWW